MPFRTAIDESLEAFFAARPTTATDLGVHRFDDAWPDVTEAGGKRIAADLRARAEGLRAIAGDVPPSTARSDAETNLPRLDATILANELEALVVESETVRPFERDPSAVLASVGAGISGLMTHAFAPKHDRLNSVDARLAGVPELLKAARARIRAPMKAGVENLAVISAALAKSLRVSYAKLGPDDVGTDTALAARLAKNAAAAASAIEAYAADVARAYPVATLSNTGIGAEGWAALARLRDGVTIPPAEVRRMGEAELERLLADLDKLMAEAGKKGETRAQFFARMQEDVAKPETVLAEYRVANKRIEDFLRAQPFVTVPWEKANLAIVPTPAQRKGVSFASMNGAGAFDTVTDAEFQVNVPDASSSPAERAGLLRFHARGAMENISIHEAIPGHYLQTLHTRMLASKVRRAFRAATNTEGWAHYCEQALPEVGYTPKDPPKAQAFFLRAALQRAVRVVIDVGLNDGSMTADQAEALLADKAFLPKEAAKIEARRAFVSPANMFSYTYGKLSILELREKVKAKEKEKFDLVTFHDRFLSMGPVPIREIGPVAFGVE